MIEVDLAIIGAGVAGLTAAAEAARLGLSVLVIERMGAGGQVMNVEAVDNMPGYDAAVSGFELGPDLQERAEAAGAQFMLDTVQGIEPGGRQGHVLRCEGESVAARAVLVAAGSERRKLHLPGEDLLAGRGISHCASCDGPLFRGQPVAVVGGGDSAFGEALVLAGHASKVTLVFREARPHAQAHLIQAVGALPNVEMLGEVQATGFKGDSGVDALLVRRADGSPHELAVRGVFVYAGLVAGTGFLNGALALDADGRIQTDAGLQSSVAGVFAAGDIRSGTAYLLSSAAEDGRAAARSIQRYLGAASAPSP